MRRAAQQASVVDHKQRRPGKGPMTLQQNGTHKLSRAAAGSGRSDDRATKQCCAYLLQ